MQQQSCLRCLSWGTILEPCSFVLMYARVFSCIVNLQPATVFGPIYSL
ncbi:hypothetical protein FOQG_17999 [Fusarium oxysporum f. sp. raphani 54005]|uniref:Uncharacterized protein n=1 Tax=Fusarium oxysporum f. sp. raphani 54005 TaxID=1089458 RepID=X0B697_FUSOX|nr:hypothetical protein FOQG_17999 [Fusarium oxysporum f. sp. raphani 54005]